MSLSSTSSHRILSTNRLQNNKKSRSASGQPAQQYLQRRPSRTTTPPRLKRQRPTRAAVPAAPAISHARHLSTGGIKGVLLPLPLPKSLENHDFFLPPGLKEAALLLFILILMKSLLLSIVIKIMAECCKRINKCELNRSQPPELQVPLPERSLGQNNSYSQLSRKPCYLS